MLNNPPALNFPEEGEKIRAQEPQNLRFNWAPIHRGSPNAAFSSEYEFSLVELWPAHVADRIAEESRTWYTVQTSFTASAMIPGD